MYVLRLILKSDGKSWAAYKVFKYNFYVGSAKKKIIVFKQKKEKGHLIHQHEELCSRKKISAGAGN